MANDKYCNRGNVLKAMSKQPRKKQKRCFQSCSHTEELRKIDVTSYTKQKDKMSTLNLHKYSTLVLILKYKDNAPDHEETFKFEPRKFSEGCGILSSAVHSIHRRPKHIRL